MSPKTDKLQQIYHNPLIQLQTTKWYLKIWHVQLRLHAEMNKFKNYHKLYHFQARTVRNLFNPSMMRLNLSRENGLVSISLVPFDQSKLKVWNFQFIISIHVCLTPKMWVLHLVNQIFPKPKSNFAAVNYTSCSHKICHATEKCIKF